MARELDALFGAPALRTAVLSVLVQSLDSGEVLYRLNPDTLVLPASNQKIVTTALAATRLGWDFRFETRLETSAAIDGGALRGDLFVVGTGDPTINARENRRETAFDDMAAGLRAAGISRVDGRLVGDDSAWADEPYGDGWQWDDLPYGYSAPVGALQFNENLVEVVVTPAAQAGAPASVVIRPDGSGLVLVNQAVTGEAGSETRLHVTRLPGHRDLIVRGTVAAGSSAIVRAAAVENPTAFFVNAMKAALQARGIEVTGDAIDADTMAEETTRASRRVLASVWSPPFSDFGRTLMKVSQNLYAETMMRALSLSPGPASMEASRKVADATLARWGVPPGQYVLADGSGLSRMNYVSATMIARILTVMARDAAFARLDATLPVAGRDGTLAGRMRGTRAEANVRAKTGTLTSVRALSGYLTTTAGERVVFAAIANNYTVPAAVVDAVVEAALEHVISRPGPAPGH
jgi:D-alanyl-D-alanine carboxypeptidase/D-alanyl-D-alanine-endopeptidase (penicillin-binding protein 4)